MENIITGKPTNVEAAKKLIERYRSITLDEILSKHSSITFFGHSIAERLTGFGKTSSCALCLHTPCDMCIYAHNSRINYHCNTSANEKTYDAISRAHTPEELLQAFKDRADHIEELIKQIKHLEDK